MSRSQLREQICQTSKSDRQEWQSLVVLNGTNNFLNGTNISFLKFMCGILNRDVANSFWNLVIQLSSRQMYFQDIYSNLWKVKVFSGNIYSLKSNTYFWGTVMLVQDGFLYLIVTRHKLTVYSLDFGIISSSFPSLLFYSLHFGIISSSFPSLLNPSSSIPFIFWYHFFCPFTTESILFYSLRFGIISSSFPSLLNPSSSIPFILVSFLLLSLH